MEPACLTISPNTSWKPQRTTNTVSGGWSPTERHFESMRRRSTKPGRRVIATHRAELVQSENLANAHLALWRAGETNPVTVALDDALEKWRSLSRGDRLVFEWPRAIGCIERLKATS
jgi:hypothetical protein